MRRRRKTSRRPLTHWSAVLVALVLALTPIVPIAGADQAGLKIVVLEGEGAVNVVQQKTAVAPVVEVRDRNDQPIAGVLVRFSIRGGRASFNGARTLSITTNAAGRAAASGLSATSSGAVQIQAAAAFQGQTATATILQSNVLTAAQAASASSAAGAGSTAGASSTAGGSSVAGASSAAGAGAAATSGGLSATMVGIVGGAGAAGAVVAKETIFTADESSAGAGAGAAADINGAIPARVAGPYAYTTVITVDTKDGRGVIRTCTSIRESTGTLTLTFQAGPNDSVAGTATDDSTEQIVGGSCGGTDTFVHHYSAALTGTPDNVQFKIVTPFSTTTVNGTETLTFGGQLSGGAVSGTLTRVQSFVHTDGNTVGGGTGTTTVNLLKP